MANRALLLMESYVLLFTLLLLNDGSCILEWRGDTVEDFLGEIPGVILQLESNIAAGGFDRAEYLHMVGSEYSGTLAILVQRIERMIERAQTLEHREINGHPIVQVVELHQTMQSLLLHINSLLTHLSSSTFEDATTLPEIVAESQSHDTPQLPVQQSGSRGRPRIAISREMIETFEEMGFTFTQTANILGVTTQTLRNRRREFGMSVGPTRYSEIDMAKDSSRICNIWRHARAATRACSVSCPRACCCFDHNGGESTLNCSEICWFLQGNGRERFQEKGSIANCCCIEIRRTFRNRGRLFLNPFFA